MTIQANIKEMHRHLRYAEREASATEPYAYRYHVLGFMACAAFLLVALARKVSHLEHAVTHVERLAKSTAKTKRPARK